MTINKTVNSIMVFLLEKVFISLGQRKIMVWKVLCNLHRQKMDKTVTHCNSDVFVIILCKICIVMYLLALCPIGSIHMAIIHEYLFLEHLLILQTPLNWVQPSWRKEPIFVSFLWGSCISNKAVTSFCRTLY